MAADFGDFGQEIGAWLRSGMAKATGTEHHDLLVRFVGWADAHLHDAPLREWLGSLSEEGLVALVEELRLFCKGLGMELRWLVDDKLGDDPVLAHAIQQVVEHYCHACRIGLEAQHEVAQQRRRQIWRSRLRVPDAEHHAEDTTASR